MEVWTGVACLVADPKCKEFRRFGEDGRGAYVKVVAAVNSKSEFTERVERISATLDCILLEFDHVQPLYQLMGEPEYPDELINMRTIALEQPSDVVFGTFHIWLESDVN